MNIIGAMLIMFSCTAAGIMKARSLSELDKTYGTLIAVLTLIKSEIATLSAPLDVTLGRAAGSANGDTGRFISQVRRSFEKLGEDSFCGIWCSAARDNLQGLSDRCINEMSLEQQNLRLLLGANKRMYIGVGGAMGLIIAIVLI